MNASIRWRLSGMMSLMYAIQGAFWPLLAVHLRDLGVEGRGRGWIFATLALGSFVMPLGAGQLVDRLLATQRLLALIFTAGAVLLVSLALGVTAHAGWLFLVFLVYWLITAPALSLGNSLALRHLKHPREEFGGVRLWGTVGWMAVGWAVSAVLTMTGSARSGQGTFAAFWVAAGLSLVLAAYCLTLPHTPPLASGTRGMAGPGLALALLRRPGVGVYLLVAFGFSLTTPFVYQVLPTYLESRGLPRAWIGTAMTLGQIPEIAALAALPWLLRRFGERATLALGIGAWALRFGSLALDPPLWVAVAGTPLHGVGIACFTVGGQIYFDGRAPRRFRASSQALLTVITAGMGCLLGSLLAGEVAGRFHGDPALVFLVPCVINVALLIYFCSGFQSLSTTVDWLGAPNAARPLGNDAVRGTVARVGNLVTESADG